MDKSVKGKRGILDSLKEWMPNFSLISSTISSVGVFCFSLFSYVEIFSEIPWMAWWVLVSTICCLLYCIIHAILFRGPILSEHTVMAWSTIISGGLLVLGTGIPSMVYCSIIAYMSVVDTTFSAMSVIAGCLVLIGSAKKGKKWLVIFPALLNAITLLFHQTTSVVHLESNNTLTSPEALPQIEFTNGLEYFPTPSTVLPDSGRRGLAPTTKGSTLHGTEAASGTTMAPLKSNVTKFAQTAVGEASGMLGYSSDVLDALKSDGLEFLGVPQHINSRGNDLTTPIMTKDRIFEMLGGVNLEFGTPDLTKKWMWIIGTLRSGSITNYEKFRLWVKVVKAVMNETGRPRESPGDGWSQEAVQVVRVVWDWLNEFEIEKLTEEAYLHLDTAFNILVYRFQCWVAETLKPVEERGEVADYLKSIKKEEIDPITSDLKEFDKLLRGGDISLWGFKAESLAKKIGDCWSEGNPPADAVGCDQYREFKSLESWLPKWINGTDMNHKNNDLDYCNERLGIMDGGLQFWNHTREMSLIACENVETARSCPEFSGLEHPADGLMRGIEGWRADYTKGKKNLIEIGSKLGRFWGGGTREGSFKYGINTNIGILVSNIRAVLWMSFTGEVFFYLGGIEDGRAKLIDETFLSNVNRMKMKEPVVLLVRLSEVFNYSIFTDAPL
jgi:hypothetical protein